MALESHVPEPDLKDEFFHEVDGLNDPLALVYDGHKLVPKSRRFKLSKDARSKALINGIEGSLAGYMTCRPLRNDPDNPYSRENPTEGYEETLGIKVGAFDDVLRLHCEKTGKKALAILDSGCGDAIAFGEILGSPYIARGESIGLTIHPLNKTDPRAQDRVVRADCIETAPKKRFDVFISALGTATHHPFGKVFAALQAVNMVHEGGLVMLGHRAATAEGVTRKFEAIGILSPADHLKTSLVFRGKSGVLKVERHPTLKEVHEILEVRSGNVFEQIY